MVYINGVELEKKKEEKRGRKSDIAAKQQRQNQLTREFACPTTTLLYSAARQAALE
jgi:hypothetical protein